MSIRYSLPIIIVIITIIPLLVIGQYNYNTQRQSIIDNSHDLILSNLINTSLTIENAILDTEEYIREMVNNEEFTSYLKEYFSANSDDDKTISRSKISLYLIQRQIFNDKIESIYIITEDHDVMITNVLDYKEVSIKTGDAAQIYEWYIKKGINKRLWYASTNRIGGSQNSLSYITKIPELMGLPNSSLICNLKSTYFSEMLSVEGNGSGNVFIFDSNAIKLLGLDIYERYHIEEIKKTLGSKNSDPHVAEINSEQHLIVNYRSKLKFWNYILITSLSDYISMSNQTVPMLIMFATGILVAIIGIWVVTKSVVAPIRSLVSAMEISEKGNLVPIKAIKNNNEIGQMVFRYNKMIYRLDNLIQKVYVQELIKKEEQIRSMQSQINEHFLYNTLNSIICIARKEGGQKTADLIYMISRYFRLNLSEGKSVVTINDIVDQIKAYLWIQKIRFGQRLITRVEVQPDILEMHVIKYLFQPIVENAVVHGLESKLGEVLVSIILEKRDGLLYFEVTDNGLGIRKDKLNELNESINTYGKVEGRNFALKNINEQIALSYGKKYRLSIKSEENIGTKVSFCIPFKTIDLEDKNE